jgi:hypothetical protein
VLDVIHRKIATIEIERRFAALEQRDKKQKSMSPRERQKSLETKITIASRPKKAARTPRSVPTPQTAGVDV